MPPSILKKRYESVVYSRSSKRSWYASKLKFIRVLQSYIQIKNTSQDKETVIYGKFDSELIGQEEIAISASKYVREYFGQKGANLARLGKEEDISLVSKHFLSAPLAFIRKSNKPKEYYVFFNEKFASIDKKHNPIRYFDPQLAIAHEFGHVLLRNQSSYDYLDDFKQRYNRSIYFLFSFVIRDLNIALFELNVDIFSIFCVLPYPEFENEIRKYNSTPLTGFLKLSKQFNLSLYTCVRRFFLYTCFSNGFYTLEDINLYSF